MPRTIVVVDDEQEIQKLVEKILTARGYSVLTVASGLELFQVLKKTQPDLIMLDVMMPGSDGYEICRQLKADPHTAQIPVMMLTVLSEPRYIQEGKDAGAQAYLTKPFELSDLEQEIQALFKEA